MGIIFAELLGAVESSTAPPAASFAKSLRSRSLISELHANRHLRIGLRRAEVGEIADHTGEPAPGRSVAQIVAGVGSAEIGPLPREIVAIQTETQLIALVDGPALGGKILHPQESGSLQNAGAQSPDGVRIRIGKRTYVEVGSLRGGGEALSHVPIGNI